MTVASWGKKGAGGTDRQNRNPYGPSSVRRKGGGELKIKQKKQKKKGRVPWDVIRNVSRLRTFLGIRGKGGERDLDAGVGESSNLQSL